ncbi:TetR/AcrR family transcriptional regulator [Rhodococcus spelaei]|uniref:TetR/AcrR family transcriptional regulator n=1 Tax=Rhodococcus spelaei TaxID=2546320 RepID=UPI0015EE9BC0|nr:TetR/AcrR family transcriptional regulator [Rhodococcus spelaei]
MTAETLGRGSRREALVRAASEVFVERGYGNCGVAEVVAVAGLGHGTFYNYFSSKRDILDAVIDRGFTLIRAQLTDVRLEDTDGLDEFFDRFQLVLERLNSLVRQDSALVRFVLFDAPAVDPALIDRLQRELARCGSIAAGSLAELRPGDLSAGVDLELVGEAMTSALLLAAVIPLDEDGGPRSDESLARPLVQLMRGGIGTYGIGAQRG